MMRVAVLLGLFLVGVARADYSPDWESLAGHPCADWFKDAKFGIFVHWGPYSVPAYAPLDRDRYAEHFLRSLKAGKAGFKEQLETHHPGKSYYDLAAEMTALDFDADKWAKIFKRAGAKYAVLTSKHHDGFCLWPCSTQPYWNSVCLGAHRDIVDEFMRGMRANGLKAGLYYSLLEGHPLYAKETIDRYVADITHPQLKEIVTKYRPDIVWPDGEWDYPAETHRSAEFLAWLLNESPVKDSVVFNDRWGNGRRGTLGDFYTTEYGHIGFDIPAEFYAHPWEECRGIAGSFGYNAYEGPDEYLTSEQCIEMLVRTVALGGNLLLNVGPDKEGRIPPIMLDRLFAMGDWLAVNGEAIYATRYNPKRYREQGKDGLYFTERDDALYVIATKAQAKPFVVRDAGTVSSVSVVGSAVEVKAERKDADLVITPVGGLAANAAKGPVVYRIARFEPSELGNAASVFTHEKKGVVAYLGGSITANPGHRTSTQAYLRKRFPETAFTFIEKGIASTCSNTGAFRFEDDVLKNGVPDLLFVEFAVNDDQDGGTYDYGESLRGMEGVIRHAREANPKMDIVMMLYVNGRQLKELQAGREPYAYAAHRAVAKRYGIPVLSFGDRLKDLIDRGEFSWERWQDCHPSEEARALIAKWLDAYLDAGFARCRRLPSAKPLPPALDERSYSRGHYNPLSNIEMNTEWFKGFNYSQPCWSDIPGLIRPLYKDEPLVWSTTPGDQINFFFAGTAVGFFVLAGPDAGMVKVEIDGKPYELDLYTPYSKQLHYPYTKMVASDLEDRRHRVVVTVLDKHNPESTGTAVRIFRVGVNGQVLNCFANAVADPAQPAAGGGKPNVMEFAGDWDVNSSVAGHVTEIITQTKVRHLPVVFAGDRDEAAVRERAKPFMEVGHPVYIMDSCREEDILALARKLKAKYDLKPKFEVTGPACVPAAAVYRKYQEKEGLFTWVHAVHAPDGFTSEDLVHSPTQVRASRAFARRSVRPVSVTKNAAGNWLVDFGRAAFGWAEAKTSVAVRAVAGEKVTEAKSVAVIPFVAIRSAEAYAAASDGADFKRLVLRTEIYSRGRCMSIPRELGEVMPMRYLEVPAGDFEPTADNVRMVALEYPFEEGESGFVSDNRLLDDVYGLCKYTLRACTFGGLYIDGDRERLPYEADAYVTQLSNYAMSSDYEVSRVTCDYLMPYPTWPTEYRLISVLLNWTYWMWSGRDDLLRKHYAQLKDEKLMERFRRDSDGLLETGGEMGRGAYEGAADMVDWPPPERFGFEFRKANAVINAYYHIGLNEMAEIADCLGKPAEAAAFRARARRVYDSFQKVFFDASRGIYVDGEGASHASIHANALAVVAGLVPEEALKGVGDWLAGREMECSVYFAQHFLEALFRTGHGARAVALMTADNDRSWIGMLKSGSTMTKESWNDGVKANIDWNHTWGASAINVIARCLAGVTPAKSGFERIRVAPDPAGLGSFDAKVPTAKGPVRVRYRRTDGEENLVVTVPAPATIAFRGETRDVAPGTHTFAVTLEQAAGGR